MAAEQKSVKFEQLTLIFLLDAEAIVHDVYFEHSLAIGDRVNHRHDYGHLTIFRGKLECIALQVEDYLLEPLLICTDNVPAFLKPFKLNLKINLLEVCLILFYLHNLFHGLSNVKIRVHDSKIIGVNLCQTKGVIHA